MTMRPSPRPEVEHLLAGFQPAELKHFFDNGFGSGIIGRELFRVAALGPERGARDQKEKSESPHFSSSYSKGVDRAKGTSLKGALTPLQFRGTPSF